MHISGKKLAFCVTLSAGILSANLMGQVQATNGNIQGDVMDKGGAFVVGAAVEADELDTQTVHPALTNGSGHFEYPSLKPGRYVVKVSKPGFATTIQENLDLTVGRTTTLKLTLQVSSTAESIVVTSAPLIDVATASSTTTLDDATIATTPVLGRKFEDLLTLTPGVSIVQGPDGDEININGQRGIFNNISLDGGDYNNGFFGEQSRRAAGGGGHHARGGERVSGGGERGECGVWAHGRRRGERDHEVRHEQVSREPV